MELKAKILPSLLAADFGNLEAGARLAESAGGDLLHIDIMDGHLVPNLSMGPDVVRMAKRAVRIPLSVHLMITNPERHIRNFAAAGADTLLIHIEAPCDVPGTLREIRKLGVRPGITLNPDTPADAISSVLGDADEVLCMTVHPGYGGQEFIRSVLPKIKALRQAARRDMDILVDGGIDVVTAVEAAKHGANAFVAGTSLFKAADMALTVRRMREGAQQALQEAW